MDGPGITVFRGAFDAAGDCRGLSGTRAPLVPGAHPAGRRRALRHAGGNRADDVPPALAEVCARLPGNRPPGIRRVLRPELRAIALGKGRRGILQPRTVPRRRHQSVCRRPADGQSAAGVLGVRAGAGECRPDQGDPCPLPDPAGPEGIRRAGARDRQCDRRFRGGVPVPDQPGPGPADRQSEPGNAGGARPAGAGFPLGGSPLPEHRRSERC